MCIQRSLYIGPCINKVSKTLRKNNLEVVFKELYQRFDVENILNYHHWTITFKLHTDASDKQLVTDINQYKNSILLFSERSSKVHYSYISNKK